MSGYYGEFHNALQALYGTQHIALAGAADIEFDKSVFDNAIKWLHTKKEFTATMLAEPEPTAVINETFRILKSPSGNLGVDVPEELAAALEQNTFIFSGFKTYHALKEASLLLKDDNGGFKPYDRYEQDVLTVHNTYNRQYLNAEYNYAVHATQMAVKWKEFEKDGDKYYLQYRTAGDEKVRADHAALSGTTLPTNDPFWDSYLPPLGWNCRCTTVQVRKGKYPLSDSAQAIEAGNVATESPKLQIFRFNPGKEMKIFPPKHPYLPKGCGDCKSGSVNLVFDTEKERCKACAMVDAASVKYSRERVREHYKKMLKGKEAVWDINNGGVDKLTVSYQDIRKVTGKAHDYPYARNMSVYYLKPLLKQAEYLGNSDDIKGDGVRGHSKDTIWHYFKIPFLSQKSFLEVREVKGKKYIHHIQDEQHFDENKIKNKVE